MKLIDDLKSCVCVAFIGVIMIGFISLMSYRTVRS